MGLLLFENIALRQLLGKTMQHFSIKLSSWYRIATRTGAKNIRTRIPMIW